MNLQQGTSANPHPIIALHFNPRFQGVGIHVGPINSRVTQTSVVLNSWINSWGAEQKSSCSMLKPGSNFVLIIKRQQQHYEISVNGSRLATYSHRISADIVDAVAIDGDVIANRVVVL